MAYQQPPHDQQQYHTQQYQQQQPVHGYSPSPQQQVQQYATPPPQQHQQYAATPPPQQQPTHVQQVVHTHQYQGQPQMQAQYAQVANPKGWQNSLMDCSPIGSCCLATWLPCILLGKTSERQRDQTLQTYDTFNSDCLMFCGIQCLTGCGWIYVLMKRSEIREKFGIEGDGMGDCCATYWCACCALIQQDKEVEARMPPGHASAQAQAQGYQAQQGMQMPQGKH